MCHSHAGLLYHLFALRATILPVSAEKLTCFRRIPFSSPMLFYRLIVFNGLGVSQRFAHGTLLTFMGGGNFALPFLRTEPALRTAPVFRSAYFPKKLFSFFSKTLDLQVRCAHPTGVFAPKRLFKPFRCCAWLIPYRQRTALSVGKRACFRFAARTLRVQGAEGNPSGAAGG